MLKRDLSTEEKRAFWARVNETAARAELSLPSWVKIKIKDIFENNPHISTHEKLNKVLEIM